MAFPAFASGVVARNIRKSDVAAATVLARLDECPWPHRA
jgi:hypothetical protein